jgi:cupin 2 domain-containing protein
MSTPNIFSDIPRTGQDEFFEVLLENPKIKIERIVSHGHSSPGDFWYDQDTNEWVAVLKGSAMLVIEGESNSVVLEAGSHINLPAHTRHRVQWTDPNEDTIWLTVHY